MRTTAEGWVAAAMAAGLALLAPLGCGRAPAGGDGAAVPRVVSLAPNLTEILFAIGAGTNLVGRTDVCTWPPEAAAVPVVGSFGRPSVEAVLRQRPTLVLTADLEDERILDPLTRAGIAHRRIVCGTLDDIPAAIREVGRLVRAGIAADAVAGRLAGELARLRAEAGAAADARPRAFAEIWGDPLMTAGRRSFVAELVRLAGCDNLGDAVDGEHVTVSPEWVIIRDPAIIFCLYMSEGTQAVQRVAGRVGWQAVSAVRRGTVYDGFNTDLLFRPGPRVLEGIAALRACVARSRGTLP